MVDTATNGETQTPNSSQRAGSEDVTVMDLWLVIRSYRHFANAMIAFSIVLGAMLAFLLPPVYEHTTAIEIGNQVINNEGDSVGDVVPIEAPETVSDKLETGYIPLIAGQFVRENPEGPAEYVIELSGSENSQIIQLLSEAPADQSALISELHRQIVEELIVDHAQTVDAMRANAELFLAEAEQKLGEMVAQERALTSQVASISDTLISLDDYTRELQVDIDKAEREIEALRVRGGNSGDRSTQMLMLSNQIGEWRRVLVEIENEEKVGIFVIRADAEVKLENNEQEQKTARNEIEYRNATLRNIQATRVLGGGTVMSPKPIAPNKPLILSASFVIGIFLAIAGSLVLDFLKRASHFEKHNS